VCKVMDDLKAENKRLRVLLRAKDARMTAAIGRVQQIERNLAHLKRWLIPLMKGNDDE